MGSSMITYKRLIFSHMCTGPLGVGGPRDLSPFRRVGGRGRREERRGRDGVGTPRLRSFRSPTSSTETDVLGHGGPHPPHRPFQRFGSDEVWRVDPPVYRVPSHPYRPFPTLRSGGPVKPFFVEGRPEGRSSVRETPP